MHGFFDQFTEIPQYNKKCLEKSHGFSNPPFITAENKIICVNCYCKLKHQCCICMRNTNKKLYRLMDYKICKTCKQDMYPQYNHIK